MPYVLLLQLLGQSLDPCAVALKAAPEYTECMVAGPGVALSRSRDEARELADISEDALKRFARYFPTKPGSYAVFFADDTAPVAQLKGAGFVSVLPWASPEKIGGLAIEGALQRSAEQAGTALPEDVATATRAKLSLVIEKIRADQRDVIAHELGHQWYEAIYWRGRTAPSGGYGTVAPDWIEETAAILMEGPVMTDVRRASFSKAWSAADPAARFRPEAIGDLGYFLRRQHPSVGKIVPGASGLTVRASSGNQGAFYDQARCFADYLLDRTGDPLVFDAMSRFLAKGGTAERWFAEQRRYPTLPRSISALQRDWASWIDAPTQQGAVRSLKAP